MMFRRTVKPLPSNAIVNNAIKVETIKNPQVFKTQQQLVAPKQQSVVPKQQVPRDFVFESSKTSTYTVLDVQKIPVNINLRNYNACVIDNTLIFRSGNVPKWTDDKIFCCKLDLNYKTVEPIKRINVISSYKNNEHVEDPRIIKHNNYYFLAYTDGYKMAVAKLDLNFDVIYSHYLTKPNEIKFEGGDGREKNWLPISKDDKIYFWYSDSPRTFLIYEDTGSSLKYLSFLKTEQKVKCNFGNIRGGCPPINYKNDFQIWFFHTLFNRTYTIGAYLTKDFTVVAITPKPLLSGGFYNMENGQHIVFPCGAIKNDDYYYVFMGLRDTEIGYLKIHIDSIEFTNLN